MITQQEWDNCIKWIEDGLSNKDAYTLAGIGKTAFYGEKKSNPNFSNSLKKAELKFKQSLVEKIATDKQWQASAWLLERKFKKEFGKVDKVENYNYNKTIPPTIEEIDAEIERLRSQVEGEGST